MIVVEMKNVLLTLSFTVGCISALQCDIPGECVGQLIGFTFQNSSTECLSTCKDTEECTWYTFVAGDNICNLLQSCTEVNVDTCGTCVSGEVACPLLCGAPGLCQGVIIHTEDASSASACQNACTNFNGCNFYSFDPTAEVCFMFDTCPTLNDNVCPDCISGTPECATGDEDVFYMVVGGYGDSGRLSDVELLSLDPDNNPVPPCLANLNDFPVKLESAAGSVDKDGIPFICGGYDGSYLDTCYGYTPMSDSWEEIGTMPSRRAYSAYTFMDGFGLVMAGGKQSSSSYLDSVIMTKDGSTFETLDTLPTASYWGCLTVVDETTLLLSGGDEASNQALSYNIATDTWTRVEDMQRSRYLHGCGTIDGSSGKEVVVAGGYGRISITDISIELFSFSIDFWRTGNNLPYPIEAAASVPYKDSFLLVGGYLYDTDEVLDTIIKYNPEDDSWLEMPAKLQTPRYWHTVIPVKQSIFNSC